jgi:hypothetical protein
MILTKQVADLIEDFIVHWQAKKYQSIEDLSNDIEEIGHELNDLDEMDLVEIAPALPAEPVKSDGQL